MVSNTSADLEEVEVKRAWTPGRLSLLDSYLPAPYSACSSRKQAAPANLWGSLVRMCSRPLQQLLLALLAISVASPVMGLTKAQVSTLSNYITGFINSSATTGQNGQLRHPMLPTLVRLSFHDCAGTACDGCVNLKITSNKGLQGAVKGLESMYTNTTLGIKTIISRADFWALAGLVAANYGAKLQVGPWGAEASTSHCNTVQPCNGAPDSHQQL